jgi:hypothetical protein
MGNIWHDFIIFDVNKKPTLKIMKQLFLIVSATCLLISCNNKAKEAALQQQATIDSMNQVMAKQHIIDSMKNVSDSIANVEKHTHGGETYSGSSTASSTTATTTTTKKKWSAKAKGAVIGAGVGAITGALVDKNHGAGALIGGVAGAGLGYGTGAVIDNKKKKQAAQGQ